MKARRYLERNTAFGPEQLVVITDAFEKAWLAVQTPYADDKARESGRTRLAGIVMEFAKQGILDGERLRDMAVEAMMRPLN